MLRLFARRVALALVLILVSSALTFALVAAAPGNVAVLLAERTAGAKATHELIERISNELGLNEPLPIRYGKWLAKAATGDLGTSLRTGRPVTEELAHRLPTTGLLLLGGGVLAFLMAIGFGLAGAISNGGAIDQMLRAIALFGASTPSFFLAAILVLFFSVRLGWLPSFGLGGAASWILPSITIAVFPGAVLSRIVRVNLQEAMARPFATAGFAKGYTRAEVLIREALPNIAVPFLTTFGAQFALMVVGAIVVETVFAWAGVGSFFIEVIRFRDFPAMQALLLLFIVFFVGVNLLMDMLCLLIDPRLRRPRRSGP